MSANVWRPGSTVNVNSANNVASQSFIATLAQAVFTLTNFSYVPGTGSLLVFVNGVVQRPGIDFLETSSTTFTLLDASYANDVVLAIGFNYTEAVASSSDAANINYTPPFSGAVSTTVKLKEAQLVSVKDFGAIGTGVADDTGAIQAAITYCYSNNSVLYWPAGTYLITASVNNLHIVKHLGSGIIKRGSDLFYINPSPNNTNILYCATSGSDSNDGLSATQPIKTLQQAFINLMYYGPELKGSWFIKLAAGTYNTTTTSSLVGLTSYNTITIQGPDVGGSPNVPTALLDSNAALTYMHTLSFSQGMKVTLKDIKIQNNTTYGCGVYTEDFCVLKLNNVHIKTITEEGVSAFNNCIVYQSGGIVDSCNVGSRACGSCRLFLTDDGLGVTNRPKIKNCLLYGIYLESNSSGEIFYCDLQDNNININLYANSHAVVLGSTCSGATTADVSVSANSNWANIVSTPNTFSSATKYIHTGASFETDVDGYRFQYDKQTNRFKFGDSALSVPLAPFHVKVGNSAITPNSDTTLFIESSSDNTVLLGAGAANHSSLAFGKNGSTVDGEVRYDNSGYLYIKTGASYRYVFNSVAFQPYVDNTYVLGSSSNRWGTVYAATGTINTSDCRDKQQVRSLSIAEGKVAKRIKNLVKAFKFNDAVTAKGDKARFHFGVVAQDIKDAFTAEGLDASCYGLFCYDEWPEQLEVKDEHGQVVTSYVAAGNRYGIRYEELLTFIISTL